MTTILYSVFYAQLNISFSSIVPQMSDVNRILLCHAQYVCITVFSPTFPTPKKRDVQNTSKVFVKGVLCVLYNVKEYHTEYTETRFFIIFCVQKGGWAEYIKEYGSQCDENIMLMYLINLLVFHDLCEDVFQYMFSISCIGR